jgi:hypothetical protein
MVESVWMKSGKATDVRSSLGEGSYFLLGCLESIMHLFGSMTIFVRGFLKSASLAQDPWEETCFTMDNTDCLSAGWWCDVEFTQRLMWFSTLLCEMSRERRWPSVSVFKVN